MFEIESTTDMTAGLDRRAMWLAFGLTLAGLACHATPPPPAPESSDTQVTTWVRLEGKRVLDQHMYSNVACAPTSALNAWLWGDAAARRAFDRLPGETDRKRLAHVIHKYGARKSTSYSDGHRFRKSGMAPLHLIALCNDLQADNHMPKVSGTFLDRRDDEGLHAHLTRIHALLERSLSAGRGVLVRLRSFSEQRHGGPPKWNGLIGHWILVTGVPAELAARRRGFPFEYLDPASGTSAAGYVYIAVRNFTAAKGNTKNWAWRSNRAFLLVNVPEMTVLGLAGEPWHRRTIVTFDFAIGAFDERR